MFSFNQNKVNFDEVIGTGKTGKVFSYQNHPNDKIWVVKCIQTSNSKTFLTNIQEIVLGFSCDHPNILPVRGYHIEYSPEKIWTIYIKLPRMVENLKEKLSKCKRFISNDEIVRHMYSLVSGLEYLHGKGIAHQDMKLENILIDSKGDIKIADVGAAKFISDDTSILVDEIIASGFYAAPELLNMDYQLKKKHLFQTDIWSLGLILTQMCYLEPIKFKNNTSGEEKEKAIGQILETLKGKYDKKVLDIISNFLKADPSKRMELSQAKRILEGVYPNLAIQSLEEKWGNLFTFDKGTIKGFDVTVKSHEWADEIIKSLMNDLMQDKKDHKTRDYKNFETLALNLQNCTSITNRQIQDLALQIGNLKHLRSLSLNFKGCNQINDDTIIKQAIQIGNNLLALESLNLDYSGCVKISDNGLGELFAQVGNNLQKLQSIAFNFKNCSKITDQALHSFVQTAILKQIKNLSLSFTDCFNLTDDALKQFSVNLPQPNNLEHLRLCYAGCVQISDEGFRDFFNQVGSKLKNLKCLTLDVSGCSNITNETIEELSLQIGSNMKSLTHLALNLSALFQIDDKGIRTLGVQIGSNLEKIQDLNIVFAYNYKEISYISEQSMAELFKQIGQNLKDIRRLCLSMPGCFQITDQTIDQLGLQIGSNLPQLEDLHLDFYKCPKITSQAMKGLSLQIGKSKRLENLYLGLMGLYNISDEAILELASQIELHLTNIKTISLDLRQCVNISNDSLVTLVHKIEAKKGIIKKLVLYLTD